MTVFRKSTLAALILLVWSATSAPAHPPDGHAGGSHDHEHMAAMARQKEKVPEEYRIMDRTPVTPHMSSLRRGKVLFESHCITCHETAGEGVDSAAAGKAPPASFRDLEHSDFFGPGEKYWIIRDGFAEAGMPGFAQRIAAADRWHLVNYIYFLQRPARRQTQGAEHAH